MDSKGHIVLQMLDVVLGSMCFRLNDKHKELPQGKQRRGKRTIAKEKLYRHIHQHIRQLRPGFNVGVNTGIESAVDYWEHSYRYWNFKSGAYEVATTLFK